MKISQWAIHQINYKKNEDDLIKYWRWHYYDHITNPFHLLLNKWIIVTKKQNSYIDILVQFKYK